MCQLKKQNQMPSHTFFEECELFLTTATAGLKPQ